MIVVNFNSYNSEIEIVKRKRFTNIDSVSQLD